MQLTRYPTVLAMLLISLLATGRAAAQPLAELVPEDALVYIGWRGASDLGPAYQGSHLKAVLDASNLPALLNDFLPRLIEQMAPRGRGDNPMAAIGPILAAAWKYPTAFYYGGFDFPENEQPMPRLAFFCKAGADAPKLARQIQEQLDATGAPVATTAKDGVVSIIMGRAPNTAKNIAGSAKFAAAMKNAGKDTVVVAYADLEGLLANIEVGVKLHAPPDGQRQFAQAVESLGLRGVKRAIITMGFEGKEWATRAFVEAPAPRRGLLSILDGKPITADLLKLVPKGAAWMTAMRMDLAKIVGDARALAKNIADPASVQEVDRMFAEMNQTLGFDLQKDLLAALGDEWVIYTDNSVAGSGMMGIVVVNRLRDAKLATATLTKLHEKVGALLAENLGPRPQRPYVDEEPDFQFDEKGAPPRARVFNEKDGKDGGFKDGAPPRPAPRAQPREAPPKRTLARKYTADGLTVNYISVPVVAPSWAVDGQNLYFTLYPQALVSAAAHVKSGGPSIADNAAFIEVRKRLAAGGDVNAVSFMDLQQTAGESYQIALLISQLAMGAADMMGVEAPPMVLPPLHKLRPHLTPGGGASWTDATGWHAASISPFPGAEIIGAQQSMIVATQAMAAGIMLPALGSARRTARQMQSSTHARGIHMGCVLYAQGANDNHPPDIATLLHGNYFSPEYMISPLDSKKIPEDFHEWTKEKKGEWANANTSYVLLPGKKVTQDSREIVIFERLHTPGMRTVAVCYADNHVNAEPVETASKLIKEQTGKTLEEWSKVKTPGAGK